MKNKNLFKVLGIALTIILLLTWVIPASNYDSYSFKATLSSIKPAGIWDMFSNLGIAFQYFWQSALLILFIGGFYGLLGKTGLLKTMVTKIASVFEGSQHWFLIISTTLFMVTSSITGIVLPLFIFVPLFMAIILSMGYKKVIALTATAGAIIIGSISVFYNELFSQALALTGIHDLWLKLGLLLLTLGITIFYLLGFGEKEDPKEEVEKSLLFNEKGVELKRKPTWPIIATFIIAFVVIVLGMIPWENLFNVKVFSDVHNAIIGVKAGNFPIFQNILGVTLLPLGRWGITEVMGLLAIFTIILVPIYGMKWKDAVEGMVEGFKKILPTALLILLINLAVILTLNSGFYTTVMNFAVGLTKSLNVFIMSILAFIGSILSVEPLYVANYNLSITNGLLGTNSSPALLLLITQTMYGAAMLIAPTSIALLAGLSYLEISYKKWLSYAWRLFLMLLIAIFIILIITILL